MVAKVIRAQKCALEKLFLVPFFATQEVLAPLANNPIMLERSIHSFGPLEHQNPSFILDSIV